MSVTPYLKRSAAFASGLALAFGLALPTAAAFISEIDFGGAASPAGQGIELSSVDPDSGYTLLIMDASPYLPTSFGVVRDVIYLPAGSGFAGVAMITDTPWPGEPARTTTLASLSPASNDTTLNLNLSRLLVVMAGNAQVQRFDNPLTDAAARERYDPATITDWLILGSGDHHSLYQTRGHDLDLIQATLGIDPLARFVDKDLGRIAGRTNYPNQATDMNAFFVGDPNAAQQFAVDAQHNYTYTPGMSNLPLNTYMPEPGSLGCLALGLLLAARFRAGRIPHRPA